MYPRLSQKSKIEGFATIVNGLERLTSISNDSILDAQGVRDTPLLLNEKQLLKNILRNNYSERNWKRCVKESFENKM